jgi:glycerol-3-phosphate dehydrogenase
MVQAYGTRLDRIMGAAKRREDIGPLLGPHGAAEVRYLMHNEWARSPEDVLWRRSKLGLRLNADERQALARFMSGSPAAQPA